MHAYCDLLMFRLCGEKRRLFAVEAPTSPFCQRQVAHKFPIIFGLCILVVLFLYMHVRTTSYAMQTLE